MGLCASAAADKSTVQDDAKRSYSPSPADWQYDDTRRMNYAVARQAKPKWKDCAPDVCASLNAATAATSVIRVQIEVARGHALRKTGASSQSYMMDVAHFLQTNVVTGFVRKLRRRNPEWRDEEEDNEKKKGAQWIEFPNGCHDHGQQEAAIFVYFGNLPCGVSPDAVRALWSDHAVLTSSPSSITIRDPGGGGDDDEDRAVDDGPAADWQQANKSGRRTHAIVSWRVSDEGSPDKATAEKWVASSFTGHSSKLKVGDNEVLPVMLGMKKV